MKISFTLLLIIAWCYVMGVLFWSLFEIPLSQPTVKPVTQPTVKSLTQPITSTILIDSSSLLYAKVFRAMREVENGGKDNPYQISRAYWEDACEYANLDWRYETYLSKLRRCEYIIIAYAHRYGAKTMEELVRMHNGGYDGHLQPETLDYWQRVRNLAYDGER